MNYEYLISSLPVHPRDTVYIVWEDDNCWRLTAEHVLYILFDEDWQLLMKVTDATDETLVYGEDLVFTSIQEALAQYSALNGGVVPRPSESRSLDIVTRDLTIIRGYYAFPGGPIPEGFYDADLSNVEISNTPGNMMRIPEENILAW